MARTICKYQLHPDNRCLWVPEGARFLQAGEQNGDIVVWALVDTEAPSFSRNVAVYGTGHEVPKDPGTYLNTVFVGPLVFHVFVDGP